ncbi:hypothetical protein W823_18300 [Williamsia sp. D3]|nr:hypothetical protein W823_18300 [Williamsia sp. D3]
MGCGPLWRERFDFEESTHLRMVWACVHVVAEFPLLMGLNPIDGV